MKKLAPWIAPFVAGLLAVTAAAYAQTRQDQPQRERLSDIDHAFIDLALRSGQEEVALARLAIEKSQNDLVRWLAQMVLSDHTAMNRKLLGIVRRSEPGARMPASREERRSPPSAAAPGSAPTSPRHRRLARLSGATFDWHFVATTIAGHQQAMQLYRRAIRQRGGHAELKKLASEGLLILKEHLDQAEYLQRQLRTRRR